MGGYEDEQSMIALQKRNLSANFLNDTTIRNDNPSQQIYSRESDIRQLCYQPPHGANVLENIQNGNTSLNETTNSVMLKHTPNNKLDETDAYPRGRVRNVVPETEETMLETTNKLQKMHQFQLDQNKPAAYPHHARYGSSASLHVIGPDGQPQNKSITTP